MESDNTTNNRYTLFIAQKGLENQEVYKGRLEEIDKVTSNFRNKRELLTWINQSFNINLDYANTEVKIAYNQNKSQRNIKILYFKDKSAIDVNLTKDKILLYSTNKMFVVKLIGRYQNSVYLLRLIEQVKKKMKANENYMESLQVLIDKIFESYKSARDVYFFIKDYESIIKKPGYDTVLSENTVDLTEMLKTLQVTYQPQLTIFDWARELNITEQVLEGIARTKRK